jgi:hypothetical protein
MRKRQKVEHGVFALYGSASVSFLKEALYRYVVANSMEHSTAKSIFQKGFLF